MSVNVSDILKRRDTALVALGYDAALRRLKDDGSEYGLLAKSIGEPAIDTSAMSVSAVITTQDEDHAKDIIITAGIDLSVHKTNPVVLWEHGFGNIGVPIGKCEDLAGNYTIVAGDRLATARTFFAQSVPDAVGIFGLYAEKILRGWSVHVRGLAVDHRRDQGPDDWPGLLIAKSVLVELSATAVPCNPYALTEVVAKGGIKSERFSPQLLKSLAAHAAPRVEQVTSGFVPPTVETPVVQTTTPAKVEPKSATSGKRQLFVRKGDEYVPLDDGTQQTPAEPEQDDTQIAPDDTRPYGAIGLDMWHTREAELAEALADIVARQDNPNVLALMEEGAANKAEWLTRIEQAYSAEYPDLEPLAHTDDVESEDTEDNVEPPSDAEKNYQRERLVKALKRLATQVAAVKAARVKRGVAKRLGKAAAGQILKAAGYLDEVGGYEGELRESMRSAAQLHANILRGMANNPSDTEDEEAKSLREKVKQYEHAVGELSANFREIKRQFNSALKGR